MFQHRGVSVIGSLSEYNGLSSQAKRVVIDKLISMYKRAALRNGFHYITVRHNPDVFYSVRVEIIRRNRKGKPVIIEAL